MEFEVFDNHFWYILKKFGFEHPFWAISPKPIIFTWAVLLVLLILCILSKIALKNKNSVSGFLVLSFIRSFYDLVLQTLGKYSYSHFAFITSLFIFIFTCNIIPLIPWLEEPTTDLSTTLALGLISFIYVQATAIGTNGIVGFFEELSSPFILFLPLNLVGELAKVVSISFRLFGNIFGGSIITRLWTSAIGGVFITEVIGLGLNLVIVSFFVLFEGFIQAFVFSMLTLTYLSIATQGHHVGEEG